jgi:hypothetical protein
MESHNSGPGVRILCIPYYKTLCCIPRDDKDKNQITQVPPVDLDWCFGWNLISTIYPRQTYRVLCTHRHPHSHHTHPHPHVHECMDTCTRAHAHICTVPCYFPRTVSFPSLLFPPATYSSRQQPCPRQSYIRKGTGNSLSYRKEPWAWCKFV